jgi:phospholipase C
MVPVDRRTVLTATAATATAAALNVTELFHSSLDRALAVEPNRATGSLQDVEHVVVLMQENRAFDNYFGAMKGVRGFNDPHPAKQPSGKTVWQQNDGIRDVPPFRPSMPNLGGQFVFGLDHSWKETHEAFNAGWYDQWIQSKSLATMMHYNREDIPWYYSLADSFTVCDAYHCSLLGPTDPNRYYMWTGWTGNDGAGGGPDLWNNESGYDWMTYPQRLQEAGISWKIYQDQGIGLDKAGGWGMTADPFIGNYGDNSLLYFHAFQNAKPGEPLYERARRGTDHKNGEDLFAQLRKDVADGTLPQVSWITAPEAYTEHGNWPVNHGMWFTAQVLDALTSNPEVWSKTAFFLVYDENDGFFDHIVPPHPNTPQVPGDSTVSTENEYFSGSGDLAGQYGLGLRVPAMVISPWSRGGWVCSETFDATSLIRFMEQRFGVMEPNITPWRRAICGDFTSAFDFSQKDTTTPSLPASSHLAPKDRRRHIGFLPLPPLVGKMPEQEGGSRPSRALGYELSLEAQLKGGALKAEFVNSGRLGAQVQVRPLAGAGKQPLSYTTGPGARLSASWPVTGTYSLEAHGPDGFFRAWGGTAERDGLESSVEAVGGGSGRLRVTVTNGQTTAASVTVKSAYGAAQSVEVAAGEHRSVVVDLMSGWYDLTLTNAADPTWSRSFAGRIHSGQPGVSQPQLAGK